jgi:8-oxo-dGTP diphosphatase/2-hydroxy-dATP diphosphatase
MKNFTLLLIISKGKMLLGYKKRGFGAGQWNGFGGKVEQGESIEEAAVREVVEEASVTPVDAKKVGILDFTFEEVPEKIMKVHVFRADNYTGVPVEAEEMKPEWFAFDKIPFDHMWSDDAFWLPLLIEGKTFEGTFHFDKPSTPDYQAKILKHELHVL